jgi:predicted DNA-binding transcriptional regulator AlpA
MQRAQVPQRPEIKMHRISDVIEITRLSHSTIYNRIRDGSLRTVKVCGARLITDEALRKLLKIEEPADG